MHTRDRARHIAKSADSQAPEAARMMSDDERLEVESKGRRTASDVKTSGERLKDVYPR